MPDEPDRAVITSREKNGVTLTKEPRWPFVLLYLFMLAGMVGVSLNTDSIRIDYSVGVVGGLLFVVGIVAYLAHGRVRRRSPFTFDGPTLLGNLPRHIFILTCIAFIGFLFFVSVIQIMIVTFNVSIFDQSCGVPSQRDTALFVWDAMARGALKFLADYLRLAPDGCAVNRTSNSAWLSALFIQFFTSIVLVWYAISFARAWYVRLRQR
jgi:hypothetical protein